jgi:hypothetical protein
VEVIGVGAFHLCEVLTSIAFEGRSMIREFQNGAFSWSGLAEIKIPSSLQHLADDCFQRCDALREVTFEENSQLKEIGVSAFSLCSLKILHFFGAVWRESKFQRNVKC